MSHQHLIEQAHKLVAIPSSTDNLPAVKEAVRFVEKIVAAHPDVTIEHFSKNGYPSFVAYFGNRRPERFDLLLAGHVDVVPGKDGQYTMTRSGNKLFGRGIYDMKMAMLVMADVFLQTNGKTDKNIGLLVLPDEETGGFNGGLHVLEQGIQADFSVYGEMTDMGVCTETRGICWVDVEFPGTTSHGGYPWEGDNAIVKASDFIQALHTTYPTPKDRYWGVTASVSSLSTSNSTYNAVPDNASLKIDFRFTAEDTQFKDEQTVTAHVESLGYDAKVVGIPVYGKAVHIPQSDPHLAQFMDVYHAVLGHDPKAIKRFASSDTRHFADYGMHCIEFGLTGSGLHADTEHVDTDSIQPYHDFLLAVATSPVVTEGAAARLETPVLVKH